MAYDGFKYLHIRRTSDRVLRYKEINIAKNPIYDGYQCGLASVVYNFLMKSPVPHVQVNLLLT